MKATIKDFKDRGINVYDELPEGYIINEDASTAPHGYVWVSNNKSFFSGERKNGLLKVESKDLAFDLTKFYQDFDTYDFNDNYDSFGEAVDDMQKILSDEESCQRLLQDLKEIQEHLKDNDPEDVQNLQEECSRLIDKLNDHIKNLEQETEKTDEMDM